MMVAPWAAGSRVPANKRPASNCKFDYRRYLDKRVRQGGWHPAFRDYRSVLTVVEADVICHLLNVGKARADEDGYIKASPSFLEAGLGISPDEQRQILSTLTDKRIIEVERRGGLRCVRIDYDKLERLVAKAHPNPAGSHRQ